MQSTMAERPTTPFGLSLAGLAISAIAGLLIALAELGMFGSFGYGSMMGGMMGGYWGPGNGMMMSGYGPWMMSGWGTSAWVWAPILVASLGLATVGVFMMNSPQTSSFKTGSILVLIGAVLGFPTAFGFIIGSVLLGLGGILGLVWSSTQRGPPQPAA